MKKIVVVIASLLVLTSCYYGEPKGTVYLGGNIPVPISFVVPNQDYTNPRVIKMDDSYFPVLFCEWNRGELSEMKWMVIETATQIPEGIERWLIQLSQKKGCH